MKKLGITACALALLVAPTSAFANTTALGTSNNLIQKQVRAPFGFKRAVLKNGDIVWVDTARSYLKNGDLYYPAYACPSSGQDPTQYIKDINSNEIDFFLADPYNLEIF